MVYYSIPCDIVLYASMLYCVVLYSIIMIIRVKTFSGIVAVAAPVLLLSCSSAALAVAAIVR